MESRRTTAGTDPRPPSLSLTTPIMVYKLTHLDLDFEPDLHDLRGGHAEISCREVGVEVHRREEPLAPDRHPGHLAIGDDHHPPQVVGDLLRIDAPQRSIAASQP